MSDRKQLEDALVAAHNAGDTEAAQLFANEIKGLSATPAPPPMSMGDQIKREALLAARAPIDAVTSLPLAAADAGVAIRNGIQNGSWLHGSPNDYQSPSSMYQQSMNAMGFPSPQTKLEKGVHFLNTAISGAKLPAPEIANPAPAGFVPTPSPKDLVLGAAQKEGYVVPPSTANPTATNKILEGAAGKLSTAQQASAKNMEVTNTLARRAAGLAEDAPITPEALKAIRDTAAQNGYEPLRALGTMRADSQYTADLARVTKTLTSVEKSFPELADTQVTDLVKAMDKKSFDSSAAVDATALLRDRASQAYAQGNNTLGRAYRQVSSALEGAIERSLSRRGADGAQLLSNFRDARQLIAKTHSVEDALNASTGDVSAIKLGQQLAKGVPLSGDLKTAAQFGQAFPKAARPMNESLPGISPLDFYGAGGVAATTKQPWYLLYPFARQAIRAGLLSGAGQGLLTSPTPIQLPPELVMGATTGLLGQ